MVVFGLGKNLLFKSVLGHYVSSSQKLIFSKKAINFAWWFLTVKYQNRLFSHSTFFTNVLLEFWGWKSFSWIKLFRLFSEWKGFYLVPSKNNMNEMRHYSSNLILFKPLLYILKYYIHWFNCTISSIFLQFNYRFIVENGH